jgi:hypothetical protein
MNLRRHVGKPGRATGPRNAVVKVKWSRYGTSEKCGYEGIGVPVLRIPNVARGLIDLGDVKRALRVSDARA